MNSEHIRTTTEGDLKIIRQYILRPAGSLPFEPAQEALDRLEKRIDEMENAMMAMSDSLGALANG